ncbi:Nicotinamidase-related amidase [Rhizobium sp. RU20A]|uniref:isochorismatase family protein n=1 Tax=Rhizobium sp. RU20A TaxID=1907412 RepID=UPI0009569F7C|nr:isochorismatase family protein [Rhizobium sp. RU20A]SIQ72228.1 Nicotinamidase-related amidase [Rhizobium sp. RU20A]
MTTALVLIDMQVGIVAGQAQPRRQRTLDRAYDTVAARLGTVTRKAREAEVPVVFVQHEDAADPHLTAGSPGWQLRAEFMPEESDHVVVKAACDAFHGTTLLDALRTLDISHLVIGGALTPFCIDTTVRRAVSYGFDVTLLSDGQMSIDMGGWSYTQVIGHHNRILEGFSAGAHTVRLVRCSDLEFAVAPKGALKVS